MSIAAGKDCCSSHGMSALQTGLRAGLHYSVTVEQAQPRLGPKKGRGRAVAPPQMFQLDDADIGFDSIEVCCVRAQLCRAPKVVVCTADGQAYRCTRKWR